MRNMLKYINIYTVVKRAAQAQPTAKLKSLEIVTRSC